MAFDDGDIEEDLATEKAAYLALVDMPDLDGDEVDLGESEDENDEDDDDALGRLPARAGQKRKSWSDGHEDELSEEEDRPRQRRRSNSVGTPQIVAEAVLTDYSRARYQNHQVGPGKEDSCPSETPNWAYRATPSSLHQLRKRPQRPLPEC